MSDDLKFQLRLNLRHLSAELVRNDRKIHQFLSDEYNDVVMKCEFDAFADYVTEA